jgi:hypothetical protein
MKLLFCETFVSIDGLDFKNSLLVNLLIGCSLDNAVIFPG